MAALAGFDWADWLFHIDADECLHLDRKRLLGEVPPDRSVVRLAPLEAVSQMRWDGEVSHFKRMLTREQIDDLVGRGLIEAPDGDEPANATYFRGHVQGKVGVRPGLDLRMQLHRVVVQGADDVLPAFSASWLEHLHYESHSGEEFVRKWLAHLDAGHVRFRPRRQRLMDEIAKVVADAGLSAEGRRGELTRIYHEQIEDDLPALLELGLLVEPRPADHRPEDFPPGQRALLEAVLDRFRTADKRYLNPQVTDLWPVDLVERLAAQEPDPAVAATLGSAVQRARKAERDRGLSRQPEQPSGGLLSRWKRR
jgi:hypothetical protein